MANPIEKPLSIIVAIANNNAIGKDNQLLWHIPEDLKRFKELTLGHKMIMGKKTWFSLPKRPLPGRESIVLTDAAEDHFEGAKMAGSIAEVLKLCDAESENFIIGGGSVYAQFLPVANKLYITRVHADFDADTFFPEIPAEEWLLTSQEHIPAQEDQPLSYTYQVFIRRRSKAVNQ